MSRETENVFSSTYLQPGSSLRATRFYKRSLTITTHDDKKDCDTQPDKSKESGLRV